MMNKVNCSMCLNCTHIVENLFWRGSGDVDHDDIMLWWLVGWWWW